MPSSHRALARPAGGAVAEPWSARLVLGWAASALTAAVVLIGCWYAVSGDYSFDEQKTALDLAIGAVVLTNLAGASALIAGRRAVASRRRALLLDLPVGRGDRQVALDDPAAGLGLLTGGVGLTNYDRPTCQMASGRDWSSVSRETHEQEGRRPCGVCRP